MFSCIAAEPVHSNFIACLGIEQKSVTNLYFSKRYPAASLRLGQKHVFYTLSHKHVRCCNDRRTKNGFSRFLIPYASFFFAFIHFLPSSLVSSVFLHIPFIWPSHCHPSPPFLRLLPLSYPPSTQNIQVQKKNSRELHNLTTHLHKIAFNIIRSSVPKLSSLSYSLMFQDQNVPNFTNAWHRLRQTILISDI